MIFTANVQDNNKEEEEEAAHDLISVKPRIISMMS